MMDLHKYFSSYAPFLTSNWSYIAIAFISIAVGALIWRKLAHNKDTRASSTSRKIPVSFKDQSEHPLSEFKEELLPDSADTNTLHSPDTPHVKYSFEELTDDQMIQSSDAFYHHMNKRRSVRFFSSRPIPLDVIKNVIKTAGTSPSGAHCEPWTFVVVQDPHIKTRIRDIIEQEEYLNYDHRMGDRWVNDLKFVGTNHEKEYLETAPYIILVFKQQYHIDDRGIKHSHYYYEISTAMASGILVAAIHNAGLVTVTTTPLNAGGQLRELLNRPQNEKVMLLLPVGYPADDATVPDIKRKELNDIMVLI